MTKLVGSSVSKSVFAPFTPSNLKTGGNFSQYDVTSQTGDTGRKPSLVSSN
jgi:hypothetical protein